MSRARRLLGHMRDRKFRYLFKRIFPQDNLVFFAGRQLLFGMGDIERFREQYRRVASRLNYEIAPATGEHQRNLLESFPDEAEKFRRRFERGATCYLALSRGEIAAYIWVQPLAASYDTNSLWSFKPDPPGGYWHFDAFVQPAYRMKGAFVYLVGTVYGRYSGGDRKQMYGETSYNNYKSIRAQTSMGYRRIRTVDFLSVLGLRLYTIYNHESGKRSFSCRFVLDPKSHRL